jgi:hypothetical protein
MGNQGWRKVPVDARTKAAAERAGEPGIRCWQREVEDGHLTVLVALAAWPPVAPGTMAP